MTVAEYLTACGGTIAGTPQIPGLPTAVMLGATMRDLFACHAMTGWLAMCASEDMSVPAPNSLATNCYKIADAMIEERRKVVRDEEAPADE